MRSCGAGRRAPRPTTTRAIAGIAPARLAARCAIRFSLRSNLPSDAIAGPQLVGWFCGGRGLCSWFAGIAPARLAARFASRFSLRSNRDRGARPGVGRWISVRTGAQAEWRAAHWLTFRGKPPQLDYDREGTPSVMVRPLGRCTSPGNGLSSASTCLRQRARAGRIGFADFDRVRPPRGVNHAATSVVAIASEGRFERSENLIAQRAARRAEAMPAIARFYRRWRAVKARRRR